jgi:hypothetical protein
LLDRLSVAAKSDVIALHVAPQCAGPGMVPLALAMSKSSHKPTPGHDVDLGMDDEDSETDNSGAELEVKPTKIAQRSTIRDILNYTMVLLERLQALK